MFPAFAGCLRGGQSPQVRSRLALARGPTGRVPISGGSWWGVAEAAPAFQA
jgi:hypothetical protein